jgi:hypothetical protein
MSWPVIVLLIIVYIVILAALVMQGPTRNG